MTSLVAFIHSPLTKALFSAWLIAAGSDLHVLVSTGETKGWTALKEFQWSTASFRWLVGIGVGALTYFGFSVTGI